MTTFTNLMVNLKTAGLPPEGAIIQIGAVFFNIKDRSFGPEFKRTINLATAVNQGGKIDPGTFMWWLRQSDDARKSVSQNDVHINDALNALNNFVIETCRFEDVIFWGNSPRFDMQILERHYQRARMAVPWFWGNEMDFRTVRKMFPSVEYNVDNKGDAAHDAVADYKFQIAHLFKIADHMAAQRK